MRILFLMNQFGGAGSAADSPRQLAESLVRRGHHVDVVAMAWQGTETAITFDRESEQLRVLRVPPVRWTSMGRAAALLFKWMASSIRARREAEKAFGTKTYDLLYTTSPAAAFWALILWATQGRVRKSFLYIVDFFPFHQRAIGLLPGGPVFRFARWAEQKLIRRFDTIGCMSEGNVRYLRAHYDLRPDQEVKILRLSTSIEPLPPIDRGLTRAAHSLPQAKVIVVFGGQITEGRGIEDILAAAQAAREKAPELHFLLCGAGRLTHLIDEYLATGADNLTHIAPLPRADYLSLASACDIGLVVTVPIADIPTFPSKTLDYLKAGLPIVAAVEDDTDFREFVEHHGFGIVTRAGDPHALLKAVIKLADDEVLRKSMASVGARVLHSSFNVDDFGHRITRSLLSATTGIGKSELLS